MAAGGGRHEGIGQEGRTALGAFFFRDAGRSSVGRISGRDLGVSLAQLPTAGTTRVRRPLPSRRAFIRCTRYLPVGVAVVYVCVCMGV